MSRSKPAGVPRDEVRDFSARVHDVVAVAQPGVRSQIPRRSTGAAPSAWLVGGRAAGRTPDSLRRRVRLRRHSRHRQQPEHPVAVAAVAVVRRAAGIHAVRASRPEFHAGAELRDRRARRRRLSRRSVCVIHLAAGVALFGVVRQTLLSPRLRERVRRRDGPLAFAVALIWIGAPAQHRVGDLCRPARREPRRDCSCC